MNTAAKQMADAYRDAVNSRSCEIRGCDAIINDQESPEVHAAGIEAIESVLVPLLQNLSESLE